MLLISAILLKIHIIELRIQKCTLEKIGIFQLAPTNIYILLNLYEKLIELIAFLTSDDSALLCCSYFF